MASAAGVKVDRNDPNVKRLVYNMYREMLGTYNDKANDIIGALPKEMVQEDQGIARQLESMMWVFVSLGKINLFKCQNGSTQVT